MNRIMLAAFGAAFGAAPVAAQEQAPRVAPEDMRWVTPALAGYTDEVLYGDVWRSSDLTLRDRSLVTVSALIMGGNTAQLPGHLNRALDNGVAPAEISGLITHLAFYAGWPNAVSSLAIARQVLEARGVSTADLQTPVTKEGEISQPRIVRKGSGPVSSGSSTNFTGSVRVSGPVKGAGTSRIGGATVSFEPGARTAWHRHVSGQTLIVTEGCGWTQREGGAVERICAGDVATVAPGEKHWHGATATTAMIHVALSETGGVQWLEKVGDAEYARGALDAQ